MTCSSPASTAAAPGCTCRWAAHAPTPTVQHREANRSVVAFFENLVGISANPHARAQLSPASAHALMALLTEHGAQLVHAMVFAALTLTRTLTRTLILTRTLTQP